MLSNIESNGISDLLKKESTRLVAHLLAPQARKFECINEFFLATKSGFKRFYEDVLCFAKLKNVPAVAKIKLMSPSKPLVIL